MSITLAQLQFQLLGRIVVEYNIIDHVCALPVCNLRCHQAARQFLPARRSKRRLYYGNVAGWVSGCLSVTAGIVSKRLNLS